ncbi:MAG: G-D-S-L family lipolytic protein [Oscillatoriales cyanobacterium C42_A2020_001]|nr:G-D-S-L family lipolytic protein [Leptolyngbyaceae cyanobacterium C42_A2020_001]
MQSILWLVSFGLNGLFITAFSIFVARRGGWTYLGRKLQLIRSSDPYEDFSNVPFYVHRLNQFAYLTIKPTDIVFLGDSLTNEAEWSELLSISIKNRAISGDTTAGLLQRLDSITQSTPHKVFLMIGINDLIRDISVEQLIQNYTTILTRFRAQSSLTQLYIQSLLPVGDRRYSPELRANILAVNQQLPTLAVAFSCIYIDLFPHFANQHGSLDSQYSQDELHLNGIAYDQWRQLIQEFVVS